MKNLEQQRRQALEKFLKRHWEFLPEEVKTFEEAERYFVKRFEAGLKFQILGFMGYYDFMGFTKIYKKDLQKEDETFILRDVYEILHEHLNLTMKRVPNEIKDFSPIRLATYKSELEGFFVIPKTLEAVHFLLGEKILKAIF